MYIARVKRTPARGAWSRRGGIPQVRERARARYTLGIALDAMRVGGLDGKLA